LIKIQTLLTLIVIITSIVTFQNLTIKFANGEDEVDSNLIIYDNNIEETVLVDYDNTMLKPKVDVYIEATPNDEKLTGGDGDDKIEGNDGDDQIMGGKGDDKINGEKGNDLLNGEFGNDKIKGGSGYDNISGETGNDAIEGGKGDDKINGEKGNDFLDGGEGNDALDGSEGIDIMMGGLGNDTFICDPSDKIVDFNPNEGDQLEGVCQVEPPKEERTISDSNNIPVSEFESLTPSQQPPIPPQSFNADDSQEDFEYASSLTQQPPLPSSLLDVNDISIEDRYGKFQ
jgi:Ca2+-binding RTX toxin-like protein